MNYDATESRFTLSRQTKERIAFVATLLAASVALAVTASLWGARPEPTAQAVTAIEAVFTGEVDNGVPVYRLPSISVVPKRDVELARRGAPMPEVQRASRPVTAS